MAWTPPSDAIEARTQTVATGGWNPPADALELKPPRPELPSLGSPMGDDLGSSIMAVAGQPGQQKPATERKVYTGSVFDTTEPEFNPEEAARLSRRAYAERKGEPARRTQYMKATPSEQIERTPGQAAADVAIGLLQGAVGIPKGIASNVLAGDNPVAQFFEEASKAGERSKSPFLQSQKAGREALLQNVGRNQGELAQTRAAFTSMFSPAGADVMAQGAGSMIPTMGMSLIGLGQKAMIATNALANAGDAAQATAEKLSQMSPQEWSNSSAYQELRATGMPHGDAVKILTPMFALPSQVVGGIVGGVSGATGLEKTLAGKAIRGGARERASRASADMLGEQLETLAPSLAGNITQRLVDEKKSLLEGLGREAIETAFGSTPGAAIAASGRAGKEAPKEIDTRGLAERMARERGFLRGEQELKPAVEEVPKPKPTEAQRIEPTFEAEPIAPEPAIATPKGITQERAQEQADIISLEKATAEPAAMPEASAEMLASETPIATEDVEEKNSVEPAVEEALSKKEPSIEETAQQKLQRLIGRSARITDARREGAITNQEYEDFRANLDAARKAVAEEGVKTEDLSPAKREILEIADKLEAAGVKGLPDGMRLAARQMAPEPNEKNMEFYRSKLKPYEEKQTAVEKKVYGLPEFFSDDEKDVARITGLMKSGPLKTRIALREANDSIQRLADTIQAAGFDIDKIIPGQVPAGIAKIKSQISNIAARSSRLAKATEAVQKKYKRADPDRVKTNAAELMSDVEEADNLIAEEPPVPSVAEQMEGVELPVSREVDALITKQRLANEDIRVLSNRTASTSLMKALAGSLKDSEMSELAGKARKIGKNPFISLVAKKGTPGSSMEDMVDSGRLDLFLPEEMRPGRPAYDNAESAEYIREKLRAKEFYTEDTRQDMEMIQRGIWDIEKEIQEELTLDEINREIQFAVNEQRELDQQAAPVAAEGEAAPLEGRAREEEELLKTQTEKELRAKQDEVSRLEKENKKLKKEVEEKAKADEQVGEFVLTGSKREADEAAAQGQQTLFSTAPPKAPPTESAAFKKWFGDSKVVDADGKPLVMYHGTNKTEGGKAFTSFDTYGSNYGLMGLGAYFTADPKVASSYTEKGKGESPTVYPVYLSIKNPIDMDAEADPAMWKSQFDGIEEYHEGGKTNESWYRAAEDLLRDQQMPGWEGAEIMQDGLRNMGFDGVTHIGGGRVKGDGTRHRVFIAFDPTQIKSATGNAGTYSTENPSIFLDIGTSTTVSEAAKRAPSVTRRAKTLNRAREQGKISDVELVAGLNAAIESAEQAKMEKPVAERARGADFIRQKLLAAKRRGELSKEAVDLAEWFIQKNPALVEDLGVSIRTPKEGGIGGQYNTLARIMVLMKDAGSDTTPVHEVLHHLERMMPPDIQAAIRKEWAKQMAQAKQKAATPNERKFFELLFKHHYHEDAKPKDFNAAVQLIKDGMVPYDFYQYVNPSEFWAVNGSDIVQGRFDAVRGGVLQRLKNWLKELGQKIKSVFGAPSTAPLLSALDSLNKGDGNFVTREMLGEATGYAAIAGKNIYDQKPLASWAIPDSTNLDTFIYSIQNKQIDMKRAVEAVKENVAKIDERFDPYMKETLFQGRAAKQTKDFLSDELEPLFKEMGRLGVTMPEMEKYLHNRHAQERNEQIAKVNPGRQDKGSGIATADAQAYLANLTRDQKSKYEQLAKMVDAIASGTRQLLVDSGLESQDTIDAWESTYDNYIPLNRDDIDYSSNHGMSVGQGYSVKGSSSKRAVGSERKVVDVLANIAMQRERAIVRAEKNRVAMALYGFAIQNPNPEFFLPVNPDAKKDIAAATQELIGMGFLPSDINNLMKEPSTLEIDPATGLAVERIHQMQRGADNVVALRVNGENRYVFFNQNNERANRMATALKNLDADKLGAILSTTAEVTRFLAAMNTQYNPIFGAYNFLRDVGTAGLQLTDTPLAGKQAEVLSPKNIFGAMRGIYSDLRAERTGKAGQSSWSKLWEEFQQRGGQTGFRDQFSSTAKRGEALQRIVDPSSWADSGLGKVFTANGTLKVPMETARKTAAPLFNWLSDYNETMENAVRLSAYKTGIENGMSKDAAAVLAKELTVNFNRKGQLATQAGAMYAFFNASVQGTTALIKTLSGPAGKKIIAGGLAIGAIQAILYSMAGFDEDEPPEFIREKNFVIPVGNGKYVAIPLPMGYNVIPNTSRLITQAAIRFIEGKKVKPIDTGFKIFESLLGAFNPIGNAGWSFQTLAPTVADPIVALMENRDWTGKKIAREDFNELDPTPGFTRYKEASSTFSRQLAKLMNTMSGGTEDAPGRISPTPDQIDFLIGQIFGGVGREALKVERTIRSTVTGEELPPHAIPLVGRFYGDTKGSSAISNAFYENLKQMNIHENSVKGMRKRKENVQEYYRENPEARLFEEAGSVEREVQALRKRRRQLVEKDAPKELVKSIEEKISTKMSRFNEKVKRREEAGK